MSNITDNLRSINEAIAEITAAVAAKTNQNGSGEDRALVTLMLDAAGVRLAELRTLLLLAAGGGMFIPEALKPLEQAINEGCKTAVDYVMAGFPSNTPEDCVVTLEQCEKNIEAARIAGLHLLGHLGAAIQRIERKHEAQREAGKPHLQVVGGTSASS
jgi:hypothetical protein